MIRIGITGQQGFIGTHLYNTLKLSSDRYSIVSFEKHFFEDQVLLDRFVAECDVIVHLASLNRHPDAQTLYKTNIVLTQELTNALERVGGPKKVIFSSSTQERYENDYGKSKRDSSEILFSWSNKSQERVAVSLTIPNVFGPFCKPFYNSVVATFCYQLTHAANPEIKTDSVINLIYVGELVNEMLKIIDSKDIASARLLIEPTSQITVTNLLKTLTSFRDTYFNNGSIPALENKFIINLFNTFRSYISLKNHFPFRLKKNSDERGSFVEIIRLHVGGQVSFSTTVSGITRGNHFHTRKIERFCVINGIARIDLRRIGTDEVLSFEVTGDAPSFVDMPIWYTHNITNIGEDELLTIFWINEFFDSTDPDTYFETV